MQIHHSPSILPKDTAGVAVVEHDVLAVSQQTECDFDC